MILFEIVGHNEGHPVYQELEISNGNRQYNFLISAVVASIKMERPFLSQTIIKAFNFQAIICLHTHAGEYRPCLVKVGEHVPPEHYRVQALMDDFVNEVNRMWETTDPVVLAAYVLWRINYIHPFINGNGRTARAAAYFVLCVKTGALLPGEKILPELIRENRDEYVECIQKMDQSFADGELKIEPLHALLSRLLEQQFASIGNDEDDLPPENLE